MEIRRELLKVKHMPPWKRKQGDDWDRLSRFIYRIRDLDTLRSVTRRTAVGNGLSLYDFGSYVIHRWYNFHTHQAALGIILAHPTAHPEPDPYHHTVDFYLKDQGFDLKLTRLPHRFGHSIAHARAHPDELARWLYVNQSQQGRFHAANRIFLVTHDADEPSRTWELRRDFTQLERVIHEFLDKPRLMEITFKDQRGNSHKPSTGVIFCVREQSPRNTS